MADLSKERLLVVSAHAVDFVWRCAGTIAKYAAAGAQVRIIDLTFGERGESAEVWATRPGIQVEQVKAIRREEANRAAELLGAEIRYLDFDDHPMVLDKLHYLKLVDEIRDFNPTVALTHHTEDPLNFDHPETARAFFWALRCAAVPGVSPETKKIGRVKVCLFEPDQPEFCNFKPDTFIDITDVMSVKTKAMELIDSQAYLVENYTGRAQYRGYLAQRVSGNKAIKYAEAYVRFEPYVGNMFV